MSLRSDADKIIEESLHTVLPDQAVKRALKGYVAGEGRIALIAAGKAAWQLANAARSALGDACTGEVWTCKSLESTRVQRCERTTRTLH